MEFEKVQEFYEKVLRSENSKILEEKLKKVKDEKSYKDFIQAELFPVAEKLGYKFNVEDIISYDKKFLQNLSEEELTNVVGGSLKHIPGAVGMFALLFMVGGGVASATGNQDAKIPIGDVSFSQQSSRDEEERNTEKLIEKEEESSSAGHDGSVSSELKTMEKSEELMEQSDDSVEVLPSDDGEARGTQDNSEGEKSIETLRADFGKLCEENKSLITRMCGLYELDFHKSTLDEIKEIRKNGGVETIQSCLESGYLSREVFERARAFKDKEKLKLSKILHVDDLEIKYKVDESNLELFMPSKHLSELRAICEKASKKNSELRKKVYKGEKSYGRWQERCAKIGVENISDLASQWNSAYKNTERLINTIKGFLIDDDILSLMKEVDAVKFQELTSREINGRNFFEEDEKFISAVTVDDVKEALNSVLEKLMNLPDNVESFVDESWCEMARERLQAYYDSFKVDLRKAAELLEPCGKCIALNGKVAVVGDIHGHFKDLQVIIAELKSQLANGEIDHVLFLGDILDRGPSSFVALKSLLEFLIENPGQVHIIKGNHEALYKRVDESRFDELSFGVLSDRYVWGSDAAFVQETGLRQSLIEFLQYAQELPISAVINNEVITVHGGIPRPTEKNVFKFFFGDKRERDSELFNGDKTTSCALWSDFDVRVTSLIGEMNANRGAGIRFGMNALKSFFDLANGYMLAGASEYLNLKHMVHAHQHNDGPFWQEQLGELSATTVISSANFIDMFRCYDEQDPDKLPKRIRNHASVLLIEEGKTPREYFGISYNGLGAKGLVLDKNSFAGSEMEILDIMLPLNKTRLKKDAFAGSKITKIVVHDEASWTLLTENREKFGINPEVVIEMRI